MWIVYFDESKDNNRFFVYSGLIVDTDQWNDAFAAVKDLRRLLREHHGIYINKELHAWKFAAGKGRIADRPLDKKLRAGIFQTIMDFVAECGYFRIISSVNTNEFLAFDRIMNRINRTAEAQGHYALMFCDQGQEAAFTKRIRRMRVFNPVWSNRGVWKDTGKETKNLPILHMLEDPVFKDSKNSYFIQLVDFCAYALLRMERPIESRTALGYDKMYETLRPITFPINNKRDPRKMGIIR